MEWKIIMTQSIMEKQVTCNWKYCRKKLIVDSTIEGCIPWVTVVGWCEFHQKVYGKQHNMMARAGLDSNDLYKNNKKKYLVIQKKAIDYVKAHTK